MRAAAAVRAQARVMGGEGASIAGAHDFDAVHAFEHAYGEGVGEAVRTARWIGDIWHGERVLQRSRYSDVAKSDNA